jgi:hypothetical protein
VCAAATAKFGVTENDLEMSSVPIVVVGFDSMIAAARAASLSRALDTAGQMCSAGVLSALLLRCLSLSFSVCCCSHHSPINTNTNTNANTHTQHTNHAVCARCVVRDNTHLRGNAPSRFAVGVALRVTVACFFCCPLRAVLSTCLSRRRLSVASHKLQQRKPKCSNTAKNITHEQTTSRRRRRRLRTQTRARTHAAEHGGGVHSIEKRSAFFNNRSS